MSGIDKSETKSNAVNILLAHQMFALLHPFTKLIWGTIAMYLWKLCIPKVKEIHV